MSKGAKIVLGVVGGIIGLLVLAVVVAYFVFIKPASPEAVCDNGFRVFKEEYEKKTGSKLDEKGLASLMGGDKKACIADEAKWRKGTSKGLLPIAQTTRCRASAKNLAEFKKCDEKLNMYRK